MLFSNLLKSVVQIGQSSETPDNSKNTKKITLTTKDSCSPSQIVKRPAYAERVEDISPECEIPRSISNISSSGGAPRKWPIFMGQYEIIQNLGSGNTAKVYLGRSIKDPSHLIAIKIMKTEYLKRSEKIIRNIEQEIQILSCMNHKNIVKLIDYGTEGQIVKPSGRKIHDIVYITMEYISGGLMFNLCQNLGGMGEDAGRFFFRQLLRVMEYMNHKNVVHRDIKIENILLDDYMNIKLADYGFATYKNIQNLKTYRGTMSYMAPEIKTGDYYDGRQSDIFSAGVVLFIIVRGIFPFKEARKDEYFYNLIVTGQTQKYFNKIKGEHLSEEFRDLIVRMLAYKGSDRPTLDQIKKHPWFTKPYNKQQTRAELMKKQQEIIQQLTLSNEKSSKETQEDNSTNETGSQEYKIKSVERRSKSANVNTN